VCVFEPIAKRQDKNAESTNCTPVNVMTVSPAADPLEGLTRRTRIGGMKVNATETDAASTASAADVPIDSRMVCAVADEGVVQRISFDETKVAFVFIFNPKKQYKLSFQKLLPLTLKTVPPMTLPLVGATFSACGSGTYSKGNAVVLQSIPLFVTLTSTTALAKRGGATHVRVVLSTHVATTVVLLKRHARREVLIKFKPLTMMRVAAFGDPFVGVNEDT